MTSQKTGSVAQTAGRLRDQILPNAQLFYSRDNLHGRNASGQPGLPRNGMTLSQVNTKVTPYALNLMMSTAEG